MCMRVDLPDPEGPITATSSPGSTARETPSRAVHRGLALAVAADEVAGDDDGVRDGGGALGRRGRREGAIAGVI